MGIFLSRETQELIEQRMKSTGVSADDLVQIAIRTLDQVSGEDYEHLDPEIRAAIEEAEAEYQQGGGIPLDEAFTRLREKHLGK
ncbi:MAG TPA: hypothetical protein VK797_20210 [Tepidisphaeraceae bacterium]|jgi:hypothetical protein|nr:hypothetical protein [Tepidisphaeraceae bacterium]